MPQEIPPPTLTETTTTTTGTYIPSTGGPSAGAIALAVGIVVVIILVWYYRGRLAKAVRQLGVLHFNYDMFLADTIDVDLSAYNKKFAVILLVILSAVMAVPSIVANFVTDMSLRGGMILIGWALCALLIFVYIQQLNIREIRDNENSVWLDAELHAPGRSSVGRTLRRTSPEYEYVLNEKQRDHMIDVVLEVAKNTGAQIPTGAKQELESRLKDMHLYRCVVRISDDKQYKILLATRHVWKEIQNTQQNPQFDRTTLVNITRAPVHLFFLGESPEVFPDLDSKGLPTYGGRTMGVFVAVIDRMIVREGLVSGHFETPDFRDALFLQILHMYMQNSITSEYVDGKIQELNKKKKEYEELRFKKVVEGQGQFNTFVRAFHRLFNPQRDREKVINWLVQFLVFGAVWFMLFKLIRWIP